MRWWLVRVCFALSNLEIEVQIITPMEQQQQDLVELRSKSLSYIQTDSGPFCLTLFSSSSDFCVAVGRSSNFPSFLKIQKQVNKTKNWSHLNHFPNSKDEIQIWGAAACPFLHDLPATPAIASRRPHNHWQNGPLTHCLKITKMSHFQLQYTLR